MVGAGEQPSARWRAGDPDLPDGVVAALARLLPDEYRAELGSDQAGENGPAVDAEIFARHGEGVGAHIMGRSMFGGGTGSWDPPWTGWWGDEPPVFVLTHHAREAAGDLDVQVSGGASVARRYLRAGLVEQLYLHVVPVVLGAGERLWDGLRLEPFEVVESPAVTHVKYRVLT